MLLPVEFKSILQLKAYLGSLLYVMEAECNSLIENITIFIYPDP
jgi:hypothetical protein